MKGARPTVPLAVQTARGERRRIQSFLREIEKLGVDLQGLPEPPAKALREADRFLGRYLDLLARETPSPEQLVGVMEALADIDRVVKSAMAEILRSLGWKPSRSQGSSRPQTARPQRRAGARSSRTPVTTGRGAKVIPFPGPSTRKPRS